MQRRPLVAAALAAGLAGSSAALAQSTLASVLQAPAVMERMLKERLDPTPSTPAQARTRMETGMPRWLKLVKERG